MMWLAIYLCTFPQSHLKKLFGGIHYVKFNEGNTHIVAMKSLEGETVPLKNPIEITTKVEVSQELPYA